MIDLSFAPLLLPEIALGVFILVFFILDLIFIRSGKASLYFALLGLGGVLFLALASPETGQNNMILIDSFSHSARLLILFSTFPALILSYYFCRDNGFIHSEINYVILVMTLGALLLVHSAHFLLFFVSLETVSICSYILCAMRRNHRTSPEISLKYFVTGAFCSAFILYGIALIYGFSGSLNLFETGETLSGIKSMNKILIYTGLFFTLAGLAFKLSLFPFHIWTPDVYEGLSTPFTSILATVPKIAVFAALVQILKTAFIELETLWMPFLAFLSVCSMIYGNLAAMGQSNLKRLAAYSSIAHAGYMIIAVMSLSGSGTSALIYYLTAYTLINFSFFGVLVLIGKDKELTEIKDLAGLGKKHPVIGFFMSVIMLGFAGFPLTAGFVGKIHVFYSGLESDLFAPVLIGILSSAFSIYYYFKIIFTVMYSGDEAEFKVDIGNSRLLTASVSFCVFLILIVGIFPSVIFNYFF